MYKKYWGTRCVVQTLCFSGGSWELGEEFMARVYLSIFNISNNNVNISIHWGLIELRLIHKYICANVAYLCH